MDYSFKNDNATFQGKGFKKTITKSYFNYGKLSCTITARIIDIYCYNQFKTDLTEDDFLLVLKSMHNEKSLINDIS